MPYPSVLVQPLEELLEIAAGKLKELGMHTENNGAPAQLYFRDPDGVLIQLERPAYRNPGLERVATSKRCPHRSSSQRDSIT